MLNMSHPRGLPGRRDATNAPTPEKTLVTQARHAWLAESLARLRDQDRTLVILHYLKGVSITDLVEVSGKSEAAVRKQLYRILQRLQRMD